MLTCSYRSIIYIFFAWMLAACGGGGGGGVDASDGNIGDGIGSISTITLSLSNNPVSSATPGTLNALLKDGNGNAVANAIVTFELAGTIGQLSPSSGTAQTNGSGVATITLNPGTVEGASSVTARSSGAIASTLNFTSSGDGTDSGGGTVTPGTTIALSITKQGITDPNSNTFNFENGEQITDAQKAVITATLSGTDDNGDPTLLSGEIVNFTTTQGTLSAAQGLTGANGQASVILSTSTIETPGTVSVSFGSIQDSENFVLAGDAPDDNAPVEISVSFRDPTTNAVLEPVEITSSQSALVQITVTKGGQGQGFTLVSVDNGGIGVLSPSGSNNVSAIFTDGNGLAEITLSAGSETEFGNLTVGSLGQTLTSQSYSIIGPDVQLGNNQGAAFVDGALYSNTVNNGDTISSGSTHVFSVDLVDASDNNSTITTGTEVTFTSDCVAAGSASIDTPVVSSNGTASATYKAQSCEGPDSIRASSQGESASISLTVLGAESSSITQQGAANPDVIALKGTTALDRPTVSEITFLVSDTNGNPAANQTVNFELLSTTGGIEIINPNPSAGGSTASGATDSNGLVVVRVEAGTVSTSVRVKASFTNASNQVIETVSEQLLITTGLPDQNSFSLSAAEQNIEAFNTDNYDVAITASGADHFNNPMPNGTTISFRSEDGGRVTAAGEECIITNGQGSCTVTWRSSGQRAGVNSDGAGGGINDRFGRTTVLAFVQGEESFIDLNGNGVFDDDGASNIDTIVTNLDEAHLDKNEDNALTQGSSDPAADEEFIDYDEDADYDDAGELDNSNNSGPDYSYDIYHGSLCSADAVARGHCADLTHVRDDILIITSTRELRGLLFGKGSNYNNLDYVNSAGAAPSVAKTTLVTGIIASSPAGITNTTTPSEDAFNVNEVQTIDLSPGTGVSSISLDLLLVDYNGNPPASGTTVNLDCSVCDVKGSSNFTVGTNLINPPRYTITLEAQDSPSKNSGTFTVEFQSPNGNSSQKSYSVTALP